MDSSMTRFVFYIRRTKRDILLILCFIPEKGLDINVMYAL